MTEQVQRKLLASVLLAVGAVSSFYFAWAAALALVLASVVLLPLSFLVAVWWMLWRDANGMD